jgi:undecaprenyl-diphosphatase
MLSLKALNTQLFEFINRGVGYYHPVDTFFVTATSAYTIAIVGFLVAVYLAIYLPLRHSGAERRRLFKHAAMVAVSVAVTYVIVAVVKVLVAYPRPFQTLSNLHVLISLPTDYSFPSGHAALTMALATAVYFQRKRLGELLFAFSFAVGIARIYVGVHYPLDVGVGFLIGYLVPKIFQLKGYFVK